MRKLSQTTFKLEGTQARKKLLINYKLIYYFDKFINLIDLLRIWLPRWRSGKESACNAGDAGDASSDPWVGKIPWRRKWQPTLVLLPGKFHRQKTWRATVHHKELHKTE